MKTKLAILLLAVVLTAAHAQTHYQRIKSFESQEFTSGSPSTIIVGREGKLYGTMNYAATALASGEGAGAIFSLNQDGSEFKILRAFQPEQAYDGSFPNRVVEGSDGALYGTTSGGGTNNSGVAFKLSKDGSNYQVLRRFNGPSEDGSNPSDLLEGTDSWLYGVTAKAYGNAANRGTIFKLRKDGSSFVVLRTFVGGEDGADPNGLIEGRDGTLYGTTYSESGASNSGTVFKLGKDGSGYMVLFWFSDGQPQTRLVEGSDGVLYGMTAAYPHCSRNQCSPVRGIVFKLNKDGTGYTVVYRFPDSVSGVPGALPRNLVEGGDGALYGTTGYGRASGLGGIASGAPPLNPGVLFRLNKDESGYAVLHQFASTSGDGNGTESLALGSDGALYGTTISGGDDGLGTVFKLFSTPPVVRISGIEASPAGIRLTASGGGAGETYQLQATTNLSATNGWQVIDSSTAGIARIDGTFQFLHAITPDQSARFYRVVAP